MEAAFVTRLASFGATFSRMASRGQSECAHGPIQFLRDILPFFMPSLNGLIALTRWHDNHLETSDFSSCCRGSDRAHGTELVDGRAQNRLAPSHQFEPRWSI